MRSFIAIDFDKNLKNGILLIQSKLRKKAVSGRWKYIDNFHLTLKFLDEIDPDKIEQIDKELKTICNNTGSFRLKVSELGFFPGKDSLRVLWLGLNGDLEKLSRFQKLIDSGLNKLGFKNEHRIYMPHITIGQDIIFNQGFDSIKEDVDLNILDEIPVDRIYLFKSEQSGNKIIYTPISEYLLIQ